MQQAIRARETMARILPDSEIRKLFGTVIRDAVEERLNPNGIEIRLGKHVLFHSTDEEMELCSGKFVKVRPGESVTITSLESFDFKREAVHGIFPGHDLMAIITPTTTMMREGILQASTKIDPGFKGVLNWGLRNSSIKDFMIEYGEPLFKLTIFMLEPGEEPESLYGERDGDRYQNSEGIIRSTRKVPVSISRKNLVESSLALLDPAKALREAGHPFDHISTELTNLHGKFEVVSTSVNVLRTAIEDEGKKLSSKVEESEKSVLGKVESLFDRKFLTIAGGVIGVLAMMFGGVTFLQSQGVTGAALGWVSFLAGLGVLIAAYFLTRRP